MASVESLVRRLRERDTAAVYEFAAARRNRLLAYIEGQFSQSLWGKVEAIDIYQETLLAAFAALPRTDLSARDPFGWFCDLADQRIVDVARKFAAQKRDVSKEQALTGSVEGFAGTPSAELMRAEEQAEVAEAVAALPPDAREAVRLRYEEGLPTQEIAARLHKSDGAVRTLLSRAVDALRKALGGDK